jgi:hypothetical protein
MGEVGSWFFTWVVSRVRKVEKSLSSVLASLAFDELELLEVPEVLVVALLFVVAVFEMV